MREIKLFIILFNLIIILFIYAVFYCTYSAGCLAPTNMPYGEGGIEGLSSFHFWKKITINHGKVYGLSDHIDFPALIMIEKDEDLLLSDNGGGVENPSGNDIIFTDASFTMQLDHEIEKYENTEGTLIAWVRIPTLKVNEDTIIYMFYGNSEINTPQEDIQHRVWRVWDSDYAGVWHLHDGVDDSTENENNGNNYGSDDTEGKIADGQYFVADEGAYIGIDNTSSLNFEGEITISAWVSPDKLSVPDGDEECGECEGGVTQLTLRYKAKTKCYDTEDGDRITVKCKDGYTVFDSYVEPGEDFTFFRTNENGEMEKLGTEISIYVNYELNTKIHTSCSQPIGPGMIFGVFTVIEGYSKDGGLLCDAGASIDDDTQNIVAHGPAYTPSEAGVMLRTTSRRVDTTYTNYYETGSWDGDLHIASAEIPSEDVGKEAWVYLAGVYDGSSWKLYKNGEEVDSRNDAPGSIKVEEDWAIGASGTGLKGFFDGKIDEVRISHVARSDSWIRTKYENQNIPSTFYTISSSPVGLCLADHIVGQETNKFGTKSSITGEELFAFRLTNFSSKDVVVDQIQFRLSHVVGIEKVHFANLNLYIDDDADGALSGAETDVGGPGVVEWIEKKIITFSADFGIPARDTVHYILTGDVHKLTAGDKMTVSLSDYNIMLIEGDVYDTGITSVTHSRLASGGGGTKIYGATNEGRSGPSNLYLLDIEEEKASPIGEIGFFRVSGMDFHPDGTLYATAEDISDDGYHTPILIKIDTESGEGTKVQVLHHPWYDSRYKPGEGIWHNYGDAVSDISFDSNETLYAYLDNGDGLAKIDISSGELDDLGPTGVYGLPGSTRPASGDGMAFSLEDELFYANEYAIFTLQQESGGTSDFKIPLQFSIPPDNDPRINGMDFDPGTGILYGSLRDGDHNTRENYLVTINTTDGNVTIIGDWTPDDLTALAVQTTGTDSISYSCCKKITIDHTMVCGECGHIDFPLLVSIENDNDLKTSDQGGDVESIQGYDIIFMDLTKTFSLDHEIELYDGAAGTLVAWVRLPLLEVNQDTILYICYGNDQINFSQENVPGVWGSHYEGVWHLTNDSFDSTENENNGNEFGLDNIKGKIAQGRDFNLFQGDHISLGNPLSLDVTRKITISAWISPDVGDNVQNIVAHGPTDTPSNAGVMLRIYAEGSCFDYKSYYDIGSWDGSFHGARYEVSACDIGRGVWVYLTGVYDGSAWRLYRNGVEVKSVTDETGPLSVEEDWAIGARGTSTEEFRDRFFDGKIDEVRISSFARSCCWIKTSYNNQNSPSTFYTISSESCSEPMENIDSALEYIQNINGYSIIIMNSDDTINLDYEIDKYADIIDTLVAFGEAPSSDSIFAVTPNGTIFTLKINVDPDNSSSVPEIQPPSAPYIIDDGNFSSNNTSFHVSWFTVAESEELLEYQYVIDTESMLESSSTIEWTSSGTSNEITHHFASPLTEGQTYYAHVRAKNSAGWGSIGTSDGIIIDITAPVVTIIDILDSSSDNETSFIKATWNADDEISGIEEYQYALGTDPDDTSSLEWISTGQDTQITHSFAPLSSPDTYEYYLWIKVKNGAGLWNIPEASEKIQLYYSIPTTPTVNNPINGAIVSSRNPVLWVNNAKDTASRELRYEFELYSASNLTPDFLIDASTDIPEGAGVTYWNIKTTLSDNTFYYWRARAYNGMYHGPWSPTCVFKVSINDPQTKAQIEISKEIRGQEPNTSVIEVSDLNSPLYNMAIEIPSFAFSEDTMVGIGRVINPPPLPDNISPIGPTIFFVPNGFICNDTINPKIMISYGLTDLGAVDIFDFNQIKIYTYNTTTLSWENLYDIQNDLENKRISGQISSFSMYTLGYTPGIDTDIIQVSGCFISVLFPENLKH
ncbi:MAG: DUF2341 domain-containing protein [bacterium]